MYNQDYKTYLEVYFNLYKEQATIVTESQFKDKCWPWLNDLENEEKEKEYRLTLNHDITGDIPSFIIDDETKEVLFIIPPGLTPIQLHNEYIPEGTSIAGQIMDGQGGRHLHPNDRKLIDHSLTLKASFDNESYTNEWNFLFEYFNKGKEEVNEIKNRFNPERKQIQETEQEESVTKETISLSDFD